MQQLDQAIAKKKKEFDVLLYQQKETKEELDALLHEKKKIKQEELVLKNTIWIVIGISNEYNWKMNILRPFNSKQKATNCMVELLLKNEKYEFHVEEFVLNA